MNQQIKNNHSTPPPDAYEPETIPEVGELDELETFVGQKKPDLALDSASDRIPFESYLDSATPYQDRYQEIALFEPGNHRDLQD